MNSAWLGLGGNLGDVQEAMAAALGQLDGYDEINVELVSAIYKTPPWGLMDQPWFLNCCALINTSFSPEELLEACQAAERTGKRERKERWGPRTIDIDILMYEGVEQVEQRLTLPHPRMTDRAFVLVPLSEIAPDLMIHGEGCQSRAETIDREGIERIDCASRWWKVYSAPY